MVWFLYVITGVTTFKRPLKVCKFPNGSRIMALLAFHIWAIASVTWPICQETAWRTCMWSLKTNCLGCPANPVTRSIVSERGAGPAEPEQRAEWTTKTSFSSRLCPRPRRTFWWAAAAATLLIWANLLSSLCVSENELSRNMHYLIKCFHIIPW